MRTPLTILAAALVVTAQAADRPILEPGQYLLHYMPRPIPAIAMAVLRLDVEDGQPKLSTLDGGSNKVEVSNIVIKDQDIRFTVVLANGAAKLTFEGKPDPTDPKRLVGSLGNDERVFPAELIPTDSDKLNTATRANRPELPDELKQAQALMTEAATLRGRMLREKDADTKAKLREEAAEAAKKAEAEVPTLYRKVIARQPGSIVAVIAAGELLERLDKLTVTPDEAKSWADEIIKYSAKYGPRIEQPARLRIAEVFAPNEPLAAAAVAFAEPVAQSSTAAINDRLRAYKVLAIAYPKSGQADRASLVQSELDKLERLLDQEYLEKVPPFQPAKFGGRKNPEANRVAVFELFTGAQCPPCVASDVGFDALMKAYKPTDVVLLQYHLHIPGPDPLTNPTSLARWEYYHDKFPSDMRGTPTTLVNGKPAGSGGGLMPQAEKKFHEFRNLIDPTLEAKTPIGLTGSAKRSGDELSVTLSVTAETDLPQTTTLKLFLVDETVRYLGGNGIRFHHQVVRGTVGPATGVKLSELQQGQWTASVRIPEVRRSLEDYLDEAAKDRPFPSPDRPTEFGTLKVIALVQDDDGGEVLQALELPITAS